MKSSSDKNMTHGHIVSLLDFGIFVMKICLHIKSIPNINFLVNNVTGD